MRNLAHRAQESAQQIQKMIEELQVGAREAVATMTESQRYSLESVEIANRAGESLSSVTRRIGEIDGMNQSVATATEEQTANRNRAGSAPGRSRRHRHRVACGRWWSRHG